MYNIEDDRDFKWKNIHKESGVDTRDSFQKTFWQMWDSVSTLAQVVSTLDQFSRKPSGSTGTVCRH
ncbi:hypothetical protein Taro_039721 [Colocasia esculenta]|uniref:Uncharacterized protein n=1 Tax=Colocasia esculenta TaxID=4460 RepID=A0A843WWI1_COLES|nr:hypothetical protein [Colocasia esculenta]